MAQLLQVGKNMELVELLGVILGAVLGAMFVGIAVALSVFAIVAMLGHDDE